MKEQLPNGGRILLVNGPEAEKYPIREILTHHLDTRFIVECALIEASSIDNLNINEYDAVIINYDRVPEIAIGLVRKIQTLNPLTAIFLSTDIPSHDFDFAALQAGGTHLLFTQESSPWTIVQILHAAIANNQITKELRLREQERDTIMDGVPALISYIDSDYRYQRANRSYYRWFGLQPQDIAGRHVSEILGPSTWKIVEPYMTRALSGETVVYETELPYFRGGARWVQVTYTPDRSEDGKIDGFVVHALDISERVRIERALDESHRRTIEMARLPEENPNPVARIAADGTVLFCNDAAAQLEWACVPGMPAPLGLRQAVSRAMEEGQPIQDEIQFSERAYSITVAPFPEDAYANVYGRDDTDRLAAEKVLRRSEVLYRAISRSIPDAAVWVVDHDLRVLIAEGDLVNRLGYIREEIEGRLIDEFDPEAERTLTIERFRFTLAGNSASYERNIGEVTLWSHYTPLRDDSGAILGAMVLTLDVTLRRQAEARLLATIAELQNVETALRRRGEELELARTAAENEKLRMEAVFEALPVGAAILDSKGSLISTNQAFDQIWTSPRPEIKSIDDFKFYNAWWIDTGEPIHPEEWGAAISIRTGESVIGQRLEIERFDGSRGYIIHSASPVFDASGEVVGCAVAILDITELHQAELSLHAYADQLRNSNETLRDFAFSASHDLQEPLRKVGAFGAMLQSQYADQIDERGQDYIRRMRSAAERMQSMIDGLLVYSRVMTQGHAFSAVDLHQVVEDVIADLDVRLALTRGQVEMDNLPVVEADPVQMHQLLLNLVGNALKFHKPDEPPRVRVSARFPQTNLVEVLVKDNGIGLDPTRSKDLFQPFRRLHGRSQFDGNGMGLAICRKIVERHGGSISVESVPEGGATFIVRLPVSQSSSG